MREELARGALAVFGVLVGLALTETVLHFALPSYGYHFPSFRITDEPLSKRAARVMDENGVRYTFDQEGFRESGTVPTADARTVLFIGDSFTQGFGVSPDETFAAVTCTQLATRGINARCLNAGVSGYGTAHELRLLQTLLARDDLHIDAVVFQVLPNNDLSDNWEDGGFDVERGTLVVRDPPRIPLAVRLRDALLDNSVARASRVVTLAANAWFNGSTGLNPHYDASAFELEQRLLQEVVATTKKRHLPIAVVVCATAWEIGRTSVSPYDESDRLERVAGTVTQLHVPWIDSRTVVTTPEDYNGDGHFSAEGNALIGERLAQELAPLLRHDR